MAGYRLWVYNSENWFLGSPNLSTQLDFWPCTNSKVGQKRYGLKATGQRILSCGLPYTRKEIYNLVLNFIFICWYCAVKLWIGSDSFTLVRKFELCLIQQTTIEEFCEKGASLLPKQPDTKTASFGRHFQPLIIPVPYFQEKCDNVYRQRCPLKIYCSSDGHCGSRLLSNKVVIGSAEPCCSSLQLDYVFLLQALPCQRVSHVFPDDLVHTFLGHLEYNLGNVFREYNLGNVF